MAMRREVEEIVTRFGVVGLGDVQAAFGSTAAALGATAAAARAASGDLDRAGRASASAARAVAEANVAMRDGARQADVVGRDRLAATIRDAQVREEAARRALADAQAAAKKAQNDFRVAPARPRGTGGIWGPQDDELYENKDRLKAARDAARELARIKAEELASLMAANRRQVREVEASNAELVRSTRMAGQERIREAEAGLRAAREAERAADARAAAAARGQGRRSAAAGRAGAPPVPVDPEAARRLRIEADAAGRAARAALNAALADARRPMSPFPAWRQGQEEQRKALQDGARAATAAAREKQRSALAAERAVQDAARETARVQALAAARAAEAWKRQLAAMAAFRKSYLPKLGLFTPLTNGAQSIGRSLVTRGLLPTLFGLGGRGLGLVGGTARMAGSAVGTVLGGAFGAGSAVLGGLGATLGLVGKVAEGIVGIGVGAVKAGANLAYELGSGAVSLLERLGSTAVSVAGRIAGVARGLAVRGALVGGIATVAAARGVRTAMDGAAEASKQTLDGSIDSGAGLYRYQLLSSAARRAGVAQEDFTSALQASKSAMANIAQDPALLSYFTRLGVATRTLDGRMRDTQAILSQLMPQLRNLNGYEKVDLLTRLFGSYEQAEKIFPLIRGLTNGGLMAQAWARQNALGSIVTQGDVLRMRAYRAATTDLEDAWKGLKLSVSRAVFTEAMQGMGDLADLIARNRLRIAGYAQTFVEVGRILGDLAKNGIAAGASIRPDAYFGVGWFRFLVDLTLDVRSTAVAFRDFGRDAAKALDLPDGSGWLLLLGKLIRGTGEVAVGALNMGREFGRAYRAVEQQSKVGGYVWTDASQGMVDVARGAFYLQRALAATAPFWRDLWAAMSGRDVQVSRFTWLLTVKTWASELWSTIMGRDREVTRFPGLLAARDAFASLGTVAKETWYAVSGQDDRVERFPVILKVRDALTDALAWAQRFGSEFWAAVSGRDAPLGGSQFPWLFTARAAVLGFVAEAKAAWGDLVAVWNGGSGKTAVGQWAAWALQKFREVRQGVLDIVDDVRKVWADVSKVWVGKTGKGDAFNFEWIRKAGEDVRWFAESLGKAWAIFEKIFAAFDRVVQFVSAGKLNGETLILVGTIATLTGLTRTLMGIAGGAGAVWGKLAGGMNAAAAAAAGGAVVGGAAAAGGGLAAGLGAAETAVVASGAAAVAATGKWAAFADKLRSVGQALAKFGGKGALAGLAAGAGLDYLAPDDSILGDVMSTAGGAISMGLTGAWIGSKAGPWGALAGGVGGALYGGYSGHSSYQERQSQSRPAEIQQPAPVPGIDPARLVMRSIDPDEAFRQSRIEAEARERNAERERAERWQREREANERIRRAQDEMDARAMRGRPSVGPQASAEPQSMFTIRTQSGRDLSFKGGFADVAALRDDLDGSLYPPGWNTA